MVARCPALTAGSFVYFGPSYSTRSVCQSRKRSCGWLVRRCVLLQLCALSYGTADTIVGNTGDKMGDAWMLCDRCSTANGQRACVWARFLGDPSTGTQPALTVRYGRQAARDRTESTCVFDVLEMCMELKRSCGFRGGGREIHLGCPD